MLFRSTDSLNTDTSTITLNITNPFLVSLTHPDYPDFANILYPTISYDWNAQYTAYSYNSNKTYKYDFGFNDVNSLNGNQTQLITNEDLNVSSTSTENKIINEEIPVDWLDKNIYAYMKIYTYENNNLLGSDMYFTPNTRYVNYGKVKFTFYDENSDSLLDGNVSIIEDRKSVV